MWNTSIFQTILAWEAPSFLYFLDNTCECLAALLIHGVHVRNCRPLSMPSPRSFELQERPELILHSPVLLLIDHTCIHSFSIHSSTPGSESRRLQEHTQTWAPLLLQDSWTAGKRSEAHELRNMKERCRRHVPGHQRCHFQGCFLKIIRGQMISKVHHEGSKFRQSRSSLKERARTREEDRAESGKGACRQPPGEDACAWP